MIPSLRHRLRSALFAVVCLGCKQEATQRVAERAAPPGSAESSRSVPRRLAGYAPQPHLVRRLGGGRRGLVSNERRVLVDSKWPRVIDGKPVPDLGRPYPIAEPLGGGVLFVGTQTVRFARKFGGELVTVASCGDVRTHGQWAALGLGHSSVLVRGCGGSPPTLHRLPTGGSPDAPVPGIEELFGLPSGLVAAIAKDGSLRVSTRAGAPWKQLLEGHAESLVVVRPDDQASDPDDDSLHVRVGGRFFAISPDGRLTATGTETVQSSTAENLSYLADWSAEPRHDSPYLFDLFARLMSPGKAVIKNGADLVFFDGWTGRVLATQRAVIPDPNCVFKRGGTPSLMACPTSQQGRLDILRIDASGAAPVRAAAFPTDAYRLDETVPGHALTLARRCDGARRKGFFCVFDRDRTWKEYSLRPKLLRDLVDVYPVAPALALADGTRVAGLARSVDEQWVIMDAVRGTVQRLPKKAVPEWAERWECLTLDRNSVRGFIEGPPGVHAGEQQQSGLLEITFDGKAIATPLKGQLSCYGARALHLLPDGTLRETLDAGRSFHVVAPPPGGARKLGRCQDTGCEVESWYRVGWGRD